jgi:hypothetical protein
MKPDISTLHKPDILILRRHLGNESRRIVSLIVRFAEQSPSRTGMFAEILGNLRTGKAGDGHGARHSDSLDFEARRESFFAWFSFPNPHGTGDRIISRIACRKVDFSTNFSGNPTQYKGRPFWSRF